MTAKLTVMPTPIDGLKIIKPMVHYDDRGCFLETYQRRDFEAIGICDEFVQDNQSNSCTGTLRGLHFQTNNAQAKLVRAVVGLVWDVAVDLRGGSPTYGKWYGVPLSVTNRLQYYIPAGFAHGFFALSSADLLYKCSELYDPEHEHGIVWNDPDIGIDWPLGGTEPLVSGRDKNLPSFKHVCKNLMEGRW